MEKRGLDMRQISILVIVITLTIILSITIAHAQDYPIVHTGITEFSSANAEIGNPGEGNSFYGQDANYQFNLANYTDNNDGTITDNITGLMWQKDPGELMSFADCFNNADTSTLGGHSDWRVPSIKELYSLIMFYGWEYTSKESSIEFINTNYFVQPYGDDLGNDRFIDAQTWSATEYKGKTMVNDSTVFGVNFVDGRIKGYPKYQPGSNFTTPKYNLCRLVRGNTNYGINNFVDNGDGTISDLATGLMWQKADDGTARDWENALAYAEGLELANKNDWRLPNVKELQSIIDYTRGPQSTQSPAINALFTCSEIDDPDGTPGHYPFYWSGTTHKTGPQEFSNAAYVAFGEALGKPNTTLLDVHGAGAQRSDPKNGNQANYPKYHGPQGDVQVVYNYVRAVRYITPQSSQLYNAADKFSIYPNPFSNRLTVSSNEALNKIDYTVFDVSGKVLLQDSISSNNNSAELDVSNLATGTYVLKINHNESFQAHIIHKQ